MKSQERKLNPGKALLGSQTRHVDNELGLLIAAQPFALMTHYLSGQDTRAAVLLAPVKTTPFFPPLGLKAREGSGRAARSQMHAFIPARK